MKTTLALTVAVGIGLSGCGKKATQPRFTMSGSDFEHPSSTLLQEIAKKQGWQIEDVKARQRAFDALESNLQPSDADWQQLIRAADYEKNGFDLSLALEFSRHMTDKYRGMVLKWCERNMEQTNDQYAAALGYDCYLRSGGPQRDFWARRLKARGQFYIEQIADADERAEARK